MLAIPMWMLFEMGLLMSRLFKPRKSRDEYDHPDPEEAEKELAKKTDG